jgi:predicted DNA-binding protein
MQTQEIMEADQVQTSIRLPKELLKKAKRYALDHDTSLAAIVVDALEAYLGNSKKPFRVS